MATVVLENSPNLPVLSIQRKLFIENVVAFGDAEDILNDKVIESDKNGGGTIVYTIDVRRNFMPGNYVVHVVGPDTTLDKMLKLDYYSVIVCREDVDPKMIHSLLIDSNCERNGKHPELSKNFISRYDWMHYRNWGWDSDESTWHDDLSTYYENTSGDASRSNDINGKKLKEKFKRCLKEHFDCNIRGLTFFVNAGRMDDIIAGKFTVERDSETIFVMMNKSLPDPVIGFVINTDSDAHSFIGGDWHYACLLTDRKTKLNFAFVFGDLYLNKFSESDQESFTHDVQKDQFTYDIEPFLYKK